MAEIHRTSMAPTKLELLTAWLPRQPWYVGDGSPDLSRAGGFRLDDPAGKVGIELMVVVDQREALVRYLVPLTYRDQPLAAADPALVGTSEHGVLGTRWVYDGVHDPVAVEQVIAMLRGRAEPQAQSESWTPDPTVEVRGDLSSVQAVARVDSGALHLTLTGSVGTQTAELLRVLLPGNRSELVGVVAGWQLPDGTAERGPVLAVR